ncbi:MAG: dockerin type I domain-containing protein, partial [Tepidisphaeraceae bacterium]
TIAAGNGGSLILDNGPNPATITDAGGTHFITAPVTLNTSVTLDVQNVGNSLTLSGPISGAGGVTSTGNGTVVLSGNNSYAGSTSVTGGTLIVASAAALPSATALTVGNGSSRATMQLANGIGQASVSSLTINSGATLDITNNALAINYVAGSSPAATIRQYLAEGYDGDTWLGFGITSSTAAGNPGLYSVGYADGNADAGTAAGPNQVLVKFTLAGDANLDGTVNFADLLVVAQNFNHALDTHGNPIDWADGDFNYDGVVNFADLLLVAQNFNQTLGAGQLEQLPGSFSAAWNLALADIRQTQSDNVPEPAMGAVLGVGAAGLLTYRRRRAEQRGHL